MTSSLAPSSSALIRPTFLFQNNPEASPDCQLKHASLLPVRDERCRSSCCAKTCVSWKCVATSRHVSASSRRGLLRSTGSCWPRRDSIGLGAKSFPQVSTWPWSRESCRLRTGGNRCRMPQVGSGVDRASPCHSSRSHGDVCDSGTRFPAGPRRRVSRCHRGLGDHRGWKIDSAHIPTLMKSGICYLVGAGPGRPWTPDDQRPCLPRARRSGGLRLPVQSAPAEVGTGVRGERLCRKEGRRAYPVSGRNQRFARREGARRQDHRPLKRWGSFSLRTGRRRGRGSGRRRMPL